MGKQIFGWDFAHAWDESEFLRFAHIRRPLFSLAFGAAQFTHGLDITNSKDESWR